MSQCRCATHYSYFFLGTVDLQKSQKKIKFRIRRLAARRTPLAAAAAATPPFSNTLENGKLSFCLKSIWGHPVIKIMIRNIQDQDIL